MNEDTVLSSEELAALQASLQKARATTQAAKVTSRKPPVNRHWAVKVLSWIAF